MKIKKHNCAFCDTGIMCGPHLKTKGNMVFNVYACNNCSATSEILVKINGKTGVAGEDLTPEERDLIGMLLLRSGK